MQELVKVQNVCFLVENAGRWSISSIPSLLSIAWVVPSGVFLGLPSTCMESLGLINCLLSSNVVNVKATDSSFQVNTKEAGTLWLKLPFRFKILHPAHKRVSPVVGLGRSGSFRVALGS